MPGGIKNNPWKECNVEFINNELRQSLNYRCNNILEGITEIKNTSESAAKDFSIKPVENYQSVVKLYAVIKQGENAPDDLVPEQWMDSANESAIQAAIGEGKTLHSKYEQALKCTLDAEKKAELDGSSVSTFSIESCVTQITNVQNEMDNNAHYRLWENNNRLSRLISRLKDELTESANLCEEIDQSFDEGIYDIASEEMLTRFRTDYQSVFKIFKAQYREDKKQISAHTKIIGTKLSDEDMIRVLVNLHKLHAVRHSLESESQEYQDNLGDLFHGTATNIGEIDREQKRFEALEQYIGALNELKNVLGQEKINSDTYRFLFKDYYSGFDTDWDKIESNYSWAKNFVETLKENEFYNDGLIGVASKGRIFADHCAHYHELLSNGFASLDKDLTWFVSLFDHGADFESEKLDVLSGKVSDCRDNLSALEDWIDYKKDCKDGEAIGLGDYISQAKPYTQEGVLRYIVELLYPISFDDMCRLFAPCMGKERVSSTVKDTVLKLLHRHYNDFVSDAEGFYSPVVSKGQTRIRKAGDRKISQISIGELKSGMLRVIHCQKKIGFTRDSLIRETLKAFGFQKVTSSASNRMEQAFDQLLSSGQLEINDAGHVSIKA